MSNSPSNTPTFDRKRFFRQLGLVAVLLLLYAGGQYLRRPSAVPEAPDSGQESENILEQLASHPLVITRHGQCRMDCREISLVEVREALHTGRINREKSDPLDSPCPTWAVEARTDDGQDVRIVFAACERETRVVTVIDLGEEHNCNCE